MCFEAAIHRRSDPQGMKCSFFLGHNITGCEKLNEGGCREGYGL
jgi:hypothetical protein